MFDRVDLRLDQEIHIDTCQINHSEPEQPEQGLAKEPTVRLAFPKAEPFVNGVEQLLDILHDPFERPHDEAKEAGDKVVGDSSPCADDRLENGFLKRLAESRVDHKDGRGRHHRRRG